MLRKLGSITTEPGFPGQAYSYSCEELPPLGGQAGDPGDGPGSNPPSESGGGPGSGPGQGNWPPGGGCFPPGCEFDERTGQRYCCN